MGRREKRIKGGAEGKLLITSLCYPVQSTIPSHLPPSPFFLSWRPWVFINLLHPRKVWSFFLLKHKIFQSLFLNSLLCSLQSCVPFTYVITEVQEGSVKFRLICVQWQSVCHFLRGRKMSGRFNV